MLDPDAGVQHAVRHLFATFARTGSARATVQAFRDEGLSFPARVRTGPHKGELTWMPLRHWRVLRTCTTPATPAPSSMGATGAARPSTARPPSRSCPVNSGRRSST
ncbi:MAG: hypothetical protein ACRD0S_12190, partial [Acidimicrobiales bacterium]